MKAVDLIELWCFGEGSIWWRLELLEEFCPMVEGLHPSVIQNDDLNMYVTSDNGKSTIVFYDGTAMRLIELYQDTIASLKTEFGWKTLFNLPIQEADDRKAVALRLARLTVDFLVLHELCHVARGHLDYYAPKGTSLPFIEFAASGPNRCISLEPMIHRIVEVDADICAIFVFGMIAKYMTPHVNRYRFPSPAAYHDSIRFVLHVLFLLFAGDARSVIAYETADEPKRHPHPLLRLRILDGYIANALSTRDTHVRPSIRTFSLAAHILKHVGIRVPDTHYSARHSPFVVDRCNLILDHRSNAWPKFIDNSRWSEVARRIDAVV